MKYLTNAILITALVGSGIAINSPALADEHGMRMHEMHDNGYGMYHDGHSWRSSLSEEQRKQIEQLKLNYKKQVYPVKARIKQAKLELALLIGSDKPKQKDIDKKIDEITSLKANKLRLKSAHQVEVRKVLTPEQRVKFDTRLLHKAYQGKKDGGCGHH